MKPSCEECDHEMNFVIDSEFEEVYFICPECEWVLYDFDLGEFTVEDIIA